MIYMIPNITVGHIFGNSVILTVVQKTIKKSWRDRGKQKADTLPGDCHAALAMT